MSSSMVVSPEAQKLSLELFDVDAAFVKSLNLAAIYLDLNLLSFREQGESNLSVGDWYLFSTLFPSSLHLTFLWRNESVRLKIDLWREVEAVRKRLDADDDDDDDVALGLLVLVFIVTVSTLDPSTIFKESWSWWSFVLSIGDLSIEVAAQTFKSDSYLVPVIEYVVCLRGRCTVTLLSSLRICLLRKKEF